jgi:regulator of sigma E protease
MTTALSTIFVLGVLIFFHELGHFIMAKRAGIRVDRFSLGFPPSIISKKYGGTIYSIGLIPLGGYVKMAGEHPDEEATGAPDEFMSKSIRTRAGVVAAGPLMNFFLAWFILWGIFFIQGEPFTPATIGSLSEDGPAITAGMQVGDKITSINDIPVSTFSEIASVISPLIEEPVSVIWDRDGQKMSATMTTMSGEGYDNRGEKIPVGMIGIGQMVEYRELGFFASAGRGLTKSFEFVEMVAKVFWDLVTFKVSMKAIGGPVFIAKVSGQMAELGFSALLFFMALLSVNLAVLNVLPIPMLDGGHLIFLMIEKIKGSPLSVNQRMIAQQIGLVFLLLIIVLVTYNDIVRFITE